ncbi:MAG: hypothetical protein H7Y89_15040 [Steroidobacteraceae bacterium]|nr:hypothetical protein [Steroidobacteraceae bacterium]
MRPLLALCLLVLCAPLAGCMRSLDERDVREFIDTADQAARKRFAPEICELRGERFKLRTKFHATKSRIPPSQMEIDRRMFCIEAGKFARIRQYRLERQSLAIEISSDRKSARVVAQYVETLPFYDDLIPVTPDDFREFQVLDVRDESIVGIESGDIVFLSTDSEIRQALIPKSSVKIPYD